MNFLNLQSNYHESAFVHPSASVIGDVTIEEDCIIAPQVSIRADEGSPFRICKGTNIQDSVIIHGLLNKYVEVDYGNYSVYIGSHCSVAHGALIHGPTAVGKKTFIGFRAIVHNSVIGRNCYIGHGAIVNGVVLPDYTHLPDGWVINTENVDSVLVRLKPVKAEFVSFNKEVVDFNKGLVQHYRNFYQGVSDA